MEKVESALDVLSRAATMVQPCPAYPTSDSEGFETPSTGSSAESEGDRTLSPETPQAPPSKELTGKWRRERRNTRLPEYRPRDTCKMALRSQSFNERRCVVGSVARAQPHSEGELSDESEEAPTNLTVNGKAPPPPEYPGLKNEAPIDMRLRSRPAPPPYSRPSVITRSNDTPPGSMSMCDPVIDEHFRRSLGDNYMTLFKKNSETPVPCKPNMKDRASSPIQFNKEDPPKPTKVIAMDVDDACVSVDDHFAKALGDTWKQIQTSRLKADERNGADVSSKEVVDDHFSKALGDTWKKIQSSKLNVDKTDEKTKEQAKIISRSGVVI